MKFTTYRFNHEQDAANAKAAEVRVLNDIVRLGLEKNAWELDAVGYTVLSPQQIGSAEILSRIRERVIELAEKKHDVKIDIRAGISKPTKKNPFAHGIFLPAILHEGEIFEHLLMHERVLALVTYLCGESCNLSNCSANIKDKDDEYLTLHTDHSGFFEPLPEHPYACNATWLLTDYSPENGSTCFVAGSHHLRRFPTPDEASDPLNYVGITAPAGSVLIWGGNMWHGALPRSAAGVRMSVLFFFTRWSQWVVDPEIPKRVTQEALDRNKRRFRRLVGLDYPQNTAKPDPTFKTVRETEMNRYA